MYVLNCKSARFFKFFDSERNQHQKDFSTTLMKTTPTTSNTNLSNAPTSNQRHTSIKKRPIVEDKTQIELIEIINDYKNNVHSISDAEQLVEDWKNRNDVQKSFREKAEQLNLMRMKYEKIQQDMKIGSAKPSPIDRLKKLLWWTKGKSSKKSDSESSAVSITIRPISSLSIQSTSSKYWRQLVHINFSHSRTFFQKSSIILTLIINK